ncbi:Spo0E family sporulation regulatory protein-aspartic acid phosphatase [Ectobacillus funiculus]|uniref:Spo0E family sporulation regulatory protein-aspartic acid phosphatase n=1 Tax=Ectobacillus funiculus TaxID=137993 RepID=A0ABV5WKA9_9BACI
MILKDVVQLSNSIEECKNKMYELVKSKDFSNIEVIKIGQQLDIKIAMLQKIINKRHLH